MKKFLLYLAVIVAAIILICKLDWGIMQWSILFSILLGVRAVKLALMSPGDTLDNKILNGISHLTGYQMSWWEERQLVAVEDYTTGSVKGLIYKWGVTILGVLSLVYLIFHGIGWLFSQPIFWIVVGSVAGVVLLVFLCIKLRKRAIEKAAEEAEKREIEFVSSCNNLVDEFVNAANIPMPVGAISHDNVDFCASALEEIKSTMSELQGSGADNAVALKKKLADKKLEVFYKVSLPAQSKELYEINPIQVNLIFKPINEAIASSDFNKLRLSMNENDNAYNNLFRTLDRQKALLDDNTMAPHLDELNKYKDMDTTTLGGLVTSSSKLADKARVLKRIYEAAKSEYEELANTRNLVNCLLEKQRIAAYESLYLGVELVNIIRDNAGGRGLSKADDVVEMHLNLNDVNLEYAGVDSDIKGLAFSSVSNLFDRMSSDDRFYNYAVENPKEVLGNQALEFIGQAIRDRNDAIESNNNAIEQIVNKLPEMVDAYSAGQAQLLRAIEIVRSIAKANRGFDKIYRPIYEKVFVQDDLSSVTMADVQALVGAMKEFNAISKTTL